MTELTEKQIMDTIYNCIVQNKLPAIKKMIASGININASIYDSSIT